MIKVIHYRNKCIGCYGCVDRAQQTWRMSKKDGKSTLLGGIERKGVWSAEIEEEDRKANELVASLCPARVIQVRVY